MSEVKRFDLVFNEHFGGGIGAKENGKFCLFSDYAEIKAQCDVLAAENAVMLKLLTNISEQYQEVQTESEENAAVIDLDYISEVNTYISRDVDGENPLLATDAYLNSVRADAVVNAAAHLGDMASGKSASTAELVKSCGRALLSFANQLRANKNGE